VTILAKHRVQTQTLQLAMSAEPAAAHLLSVGWLTAADAAYLDKLDNITRSSFFETNFLKPQQT